MAAISNDWLPVFQGEFRKPYYKQLYQTVMKEYNTRKIYPAPDDIFNAFQLTPFHKVKAVILGQDPYHGEGPGPRPLFFGQAGCGNPAVAGEYLSGAAR